MKTLLLDCDFDEYRWNIKLKAVKIIHTIAVGWSLLSALVIPPTIKKTNV